MKKVEFFLVVLLLIAGQVCADVESFLSEDKLTDPAEIISGFEYGLETTKVIVNLVDDSMVKSSTDFNSVESLSVLQAEIEEKQISVLSQLDQNGFGLRHLFENQAGFSCEVTAGVLQQLINDPLVKSIEPIFILEPHLRQGLDLIEAEPVRSQFNGQGISIAICDTGIDYTHPKLGDGFFPNDKVIGGFDFGDDDEDPMGVGQAHGTSCAGIAAGDIGNVGDYVGGVAHGAKLYALKISPDYSGGASTDDLLAAWDWCVSHKNDDPANPIMVISTSFGGGSFESACDGEFTSLKTTADNATAAGITILVSSGNDGFCSSIGAPACLSNVISVGAVYDTWFEDIGFCVDANSCLEKYPTDLCSSGFFAVDSPNVDKVTCYSNTAGILDILAPSHMAYTTDIVGSSGNSSGDYFEEFGGTSAACPYAAGVVACIQHAAKKLLGEYLTVSQVKELLNSSGDQITDDKISITKPRVNLSAAVFSWGVDFYEKDDEASLANSISTTGAQQSHSISPIGDVDWVRFNIISDSSVTIETFGAGDDTFITLYDSELNVIASDDNSGNRDFSMIKTTLSAGAYYLEVKEDGDDAKIDEYSVSVLAKMLNPDIQMDGVVNFEDFADLALRWLDSDCGSSNNCENADIDEDGFVDTNDLGLLASGWLDYRCPGMVFLGVGDMQWAMSKYEVTNKQYCVYLNSAYPDKIKVVDGSVYSVDDVNEVEPYFDIYHYNSYSQIDFNDGEFTVRTKDANDMSQHPVVCVSWYGANAFCDFYGYRLPTEDEWEFAALGGLGDVDYPWGGDWDDTLGNCWRSWDDFESGQWPWTTPISYYVEQNGYYFNDIVGNVSEWTSSHYGNYKILRGGSWYSFYDDCTIAQRVGSNPGNRFFHYGFRPVMEMIIE